MQRHEGLIINHFHEIIYGFIFHDIQTCIQGRANFIAALALLSYTEYLGGLISGNLGVRTESKNNFNKALKYFPEEYLNVDSSLKIEYQDKNGRVKPDDGIYAIYRCGLAHEYFIKGIATIYNNPDGPTRDHIGIVVAQHQIEWPEEYGIPPVTNKVLEFYTNEYFRDYRSAVNKFFKSLIVDKDATLLKAFNDSLDRVYSRRIL